MPVWVPSAPEVGPHHALLMACLNRQEYQRHWLSSPEAMTREGEGHTLDWFVHGSGQKASQRLEVNRHYSFDRMASVIAVRHVFTTPQTDERKQHTKSLSLPKTLADSNALQVEYSLNLHRQRRQEKEKHSRCEQSVRRCARLVFSVVGSSLSLAMKGDRKHRRHIVVVKGKRLCPVFE